MNSAENKSRPKLLTWLCIGSFISGALWIIMLFMLIMFSVKGNIPDELFPKLAVEYAEAGYLFMFVMILLALLGMAGVLLMWQMKITGLYLYAVVKASLYYLPVLFIGNNHLTFIGLSITSAVLIMYGAQFMNLRKKI